LFTIERERERKIPKWCDPSRIVVEGGFKEFRFREKQKGFFFISHFLIRINLKAKNEIFLCKKTLIKNKLVNKI